MDLVKSASRNYQKLSSLPLQFWLFPLSVCLLKLPVMARTVVALAAAPGGSERAAGQRSVAAVGDSASQMGYWWEPIRVGTSPSCWSRQHLRKTATNTLSSCVRPESGGWSERLRVGDS